MDSNFIKDLLFYLETDKHEMYHILKFNSVRFNRAESLYNDGEYKNMVECLFDVIISEWFKENKMEMDYLDKLNPPDNYFGEQI